MATKSIIKNIEISDPAEAEKLVKALEEAKKICDGAHFCVEGCEACEDNEYCDFRESEEGMERLTMRVDNGLEEIYFYNPDDPEGEYTLSDIAKNGHDDICDQIANRLAAYEDTGLTPEQIQAQRQDIESLQRELNAEISVNEALTADKDEQAGRIMRMDYLLRRTLPILEATNNQQELIDAIDALLGGAKDGK